MVRPQIVKYLFAIIFYCLALHATTARAQSVGLSFYSMPGFSDGECKMALDALDKFSVPALAVLWQTFGEDTSCVEAFLERFADKPHILEIHMSNQTCLHGRVCYEGEILPGKTKASTYARLLEAKDADLLSLIQARVDEVVAFVATHKNSNSRIIISTGLEDNFTSPAYNLVLSLLKAAQSVTDFEIARSPYNRKAYPETLGEGDLIELHGFKPKLDPSLNGRCIINNDGEDIVFHSSPADKELTVNQVPSFLKRYLDKGCLVFLWWSSPQGLGQNLKDGQSIPPRERNFVLNSSQLSKIDGIFRKKSYLQDYLK